MRLLGTTPDADDGARINDKRGISLLLFWLLLLQQVLPGM
jgi:hypothetical protein